MPDSPEVKDRIQISDSFEEIAESPVSKKVVKGIASQYYAPGEERQDLEQAALVGLWKATNDFDPEAGSSFHNFAILCIQRNVITAVKTATRNKHTPLNQSASIHDQGPTDDDLAIEDMLPSTYKSTPEEILIYKEWLLSFNDVFHGFSFLEQEVYELCALQGFSYDQAASMLGEEVKSIDNALQRAKRKMKDKLDSPFMN